MKNKLPVIIITAIAVLLLANGLLFTVEEGHQAVITRLGKIEKVYTEAGLKYKIPFVDTVVLFPKKIQSWNNNPKDILTQDQEILLINATVRWRIIDPIKFYEVNYSIDRAHAKLDSILDGDIKNVIAANYRYEAVRSSNKMNENLKEGQKIEVVEKGRYELTQQIKDLAQPKLSEQGIEIVDVIFKKVRFSDDLQDSVFQRMIKARNIIAAEYRAQGEAAKRKIINETDKDKQRIISEAKAYSQVTKGAADAAAAKIYAEAYSADPEFYTFWRSMESYKETLPKFNKTLSTDMDYFKYLYNYD